MPSESWLCLVFSGLLGQPTVWLLTVIQALVGDPGHQGRVGTPSPRCGQEQQPQQCREQRPNPSHPGCSLGEQGRQCGLALVPLSSQGPGLRAVLEGGRAPGSGERKACELEPACDTTEARVGLVSRCKPIPLSPAWWGPPYTLWRFSLASASLLTSLLGRPGVTDGKPRSPQGGSPAHESRKEK